MVCCNHPDPALVFHWPLAIGIIIEIEINPGQPSLISHFNFIPTHITYPCAPHPAEHALKFQLSADSRKKIRFLKVKVPPLQCPQH